MSGHCCICMGELLAPDYSAPAPSITSMAVKVPLPLEVWVCRNCAHAQSSELPDLSSYYDSEYQISLASDDHDQLYEVVDGREIFRTEKQAQLVIDLTPLGEGAKVLDYGAAKAATLCRLCEMRGDIVPHVFDVSASYAGHWSTWLVDDRCARYELPENWGRKFDLVTAHFVMEHVAQPLMVLSDLRAVLKAGGLLFLSVPNALSNSGDLLVADHINHFSKNSLELAFRQAGFRLKLIDDRVYRGAFVAVAEAIIADSVDPDHPMTADTEVYALVELCRFWDTATRRLAEGVAARGHHRCAIYGAGFYGSFIATRIGESADVGCFIDRNPHVRSQPHMGRLVVAPSDLPEDIKIVYAGLNPASARAVMSDIAEWRGRDIEVVYLDDYIEGGR